VASLYRLDVIVRGNSEIAQDKAIKWTKNWVNDRQEATSNKDEDGNYIKEFYADLFDSRTNKSWKVFSDVATKNRSIENEYKCEDGKIIKGIIYLSEVIDEIEKLKIEIAFLKAQIYDKPSSNNENVKIIV